MTEISDKFDELHERYQETLKRKQEKREAIKSFVDVAYEKELDKILDYILSIQEKYE